MFGFHHHYAAVAVMLTLAIGMTLERLLQPHTPIIAIVTFALCALEVVAWVLYVNAIPIRARIYRPSDDDSGRP